MEKDIPLKKWAAGSYTIPEEFREFAKDKRKQFLDVIPNLSGQTWGFKSKTLFKEITESNRRQGSELKKLS